MRGRTRTVSKETTSPPATAATLAARRVLAAPADPRTPEQDKTHDPVQEWRQRDSSGISKASHTARQIVFGSIPSARAWSTVRPPRPASTKSLATLAAYVSPNCAPIFCQNTVSRTAPGYRRPNARPPKDGDRCAIPSDCRSGQVRDVHRLKLPRAEVRQQ